ncbi:MAG: amylo-alpha-1,6-glucosidase [Acetobacteraceae bacterium]
MDEPAEPQPAGRSGPFYISATASLAEQRPRTLKAGDTFAVFGHSGDATPGPGSAEGIYHRDTRYLSRVALTINGARPLLLSSAVSDDNAMLTCDLANPDLHTVSSKQLDRGQVHVRRAKFLWRGTCHERFTIHNFSRSRLEIVLAIGFAADFVDLFEVRGTHRSRRGTVHPPRLEPGLAVLRYEGLDQLARSTRLSFDPVPDALEADEARYELTLAPGAGAAVTLEIVCLEGEPDPAPSSGFFRAMRAARRDRRTAHQEYAAIDSDNAVFNEVMRRATADLIMLVTDTDHGPFPYAGIPWFSTAFGRDAIITGLETLWLQPALARGVLGYLAANQATVVDPEADADPGKILHEVRHGEMARLGEVPFRRYYGAVDSTPLFVMLAGAYLDRTGDLATLAALWPNIEAALTWLDRYGDEDGDGFVEYGRRSHRGLVNQGWKDSFDAIFHDDGSLARGPIALCEVQAYAFAARIAAGRIAEALGKPERARDLAAAAERLRESFESRFWDQALGLYVLALDGRKAPCRVRASNAGHTLMAGLPSAERAAAIAGKLLDRSFFSKWGIRTLAAGEPRYNPMSYHNGSVWPHDNALIVLGLARYGFREAAARVLSGLFAVGRHADLHRLPELFCGFPRMRNQGPTGYPLACSPQAWAAAALPGALGACLGLGFHPGERSVIFNHPVLPDFITWLHLKNLTLGSGAIDIVLHRVGRTTVAMGVTARRGDIRATMTG